jgi:hypothetical protein
MIIIGYITHRRIYMSKIQVRLYKVLKWNIYDDTDAEYVCGDITKEEAVRRCNELNRTKSFDEDEYTVDSYMVYLEEGDHRIPVAV